MQLIWRASSAIKNRRSIKFVFIDCAGRSHRKTWQISLDKSTCAIVRFILNQKRETKQIIGKYTQNADDVQLEEAWRSLSTQTEIPPYVSVSQLQGQTAMLAEDQPELNRFDAKTMVDNSVIKRLDDSGWIKKLFGK